MKKERDTLKSYIIDKEEAEEGAYAEKTLQDLRIKFKKDISEETEASLKIIAEIKGEEAIASYREQKSGKKVERSKKPRYLPYEIDLIVKKLLDNKED